GPAAVPLCLLHRAVHKVPVPRGDHPAPGEQRGAALLRDQDGGARLAPPSIGNRPHRPRPERRMPADPLRFVLISYSCNFWGLAALRALLASAAECDTPVHVDLIHNGKSRTMIDHFRSCAARGPNATVTHITAYEGVFQQVENYADFPGSEFNRHLRHHGFVLNWLIKYRLPRGRHYFLDHDAIAVPPFVGWLSEIADTFADKLFVFPHHDWKSLTAPMFSCDTSVRDWLSEFCDLGWTTGVVAYERARLGRCERFYTDRPLE